MKKDLKKGSWSVEEDQKLVSYINRYGIWNWSLMPKFAGLSRTGKSCRLRWMNYLKPNLKRGEFSKQEDESILHFHSLLGNKWSAIASKLPGRTDNDIKNYWHSHLKKYAREKNLVSPTNKQIDNKLSPPFENMQHADHMDHVFKSHFSSKQDVSSSSSTTTSKDAEAEFRANYNDTSSPESFDDLQCFWDQLCPFENLELKNINRHMDALSNHNFQDSDDDLLCPCTLSNNHYNSSLIFYP